MTCVVQSYMTDERSMMDVFPLMDTEVFQFMMEVFPLMHTEAFQYEAALKNYEKPSKWQIHKYTSTKLYTHMELAQWLRKAYKHY